MKEMTSEERVLAAMRRQDVDRVPVVQDFWTGDPDEQRFRWDGLEDRIAWDRRWGFDSCIYLPAPWEGAGYPQAESGVEQRLWKEEDPTEPYPILCSEWSSPRGKLSSKIRQTADYGAETVRLFNDLNTPRYAEPLFASGGDMLALVRMDPFRIKSGHALEEWREECRRLRRLADREGIVLGCNSGTALDYLIWAARAQEAVLLAVDYPDESRQLLEYLNGFSDRCVELCLELGAEFVLRRGWYDSADFWSPKQFGELAVPFIRKEAEMARHAGAVSVYLMCTGICPMLPELAELEFDCLQKIEPVVTGQDLREIVAVLGAEKSFWTGLSAPMHIGLGSPEGCRKAVRDAYDIFGRRGLILMAVPSVRRHWPWDENLGAMMAEYREIEGL